MEKIAQIFPVTKEELSENDLTTISSSQIEREQFIQYTRYIIETVLNVKRHGDNIEIEEYNPETKTYYNKVITSEEQAKNVILKELDKLSFEELLELYKYYSVKKLINEN
ncbi:hypothetical protein IBB71_12760 [Listeria welshimeri]|uniref:hypothetical protein n=1 Tax=Listeria welshimeri TaxID=1643 RepID=UPI00162AF0EB|nr:hypothetical protein [Listeria welshimeri]MBC1361673.1 hypothetical protein [Listeria welshimeri]MBF2357980.1 hypothetical protein [Listeria welshimeri]MBF2380367.1 hypothetical protein [Listeria welshimeri]MBF2506786.1 hypothetical protein [Listeria welshimeri]MBF2659355.1 hypothetical protein [Listeria welshimeri]